MHKRTTRAISLGGLSIGGGAPVMVQSMTNTDTRDAEATLAQIARLEARGCEAVRGTSSCGGGPGFTLLVATFAVCVLLGSALLRTFLIPDPGSSSFLAVGLVAVVALLLSTAGLLLIGFESLFAADARAGEWIGDLLFLGASISRYPLEGYREKCLTKTILGTRFAKKPIELDIPITIAGMSFEGVTGNFTLDKKGSPKKSVVVLELKDGKPQYKITIQPAK